MLLVAKWEPFLIVASNKCKDLGENEGAVPTDDEELAVLRRG